MARTTIRTEDITASEVTTAKMAVDPTNASNLSSGSVPTAQLGNVDTAGLEDDIALLGFKVASNGSLAKYDLVDQTVDDFQDTSGVDASASTNEVRDSSGKYYSGTSISSGNIAALTTVQTSTWTSPSNATGNMEILVVAGGGGSGKNQGGGGGAGGIVHHTSFSVTGSQAYGYTVGSGGSGSGSDSSPGTNGGNSIFDSAAVVGTITAVGGGGGASMSADAATGGGSGGGGASGQDGHATGATATQGDSGGGTGYGNNGGTGATSGAPWNWGAAAGGGGASAVGGNGSSSYSGAGGAGKLFSTFVAYGTDSSNAASTGSNGGYFGGGGGGGDNNVSSGSGGVGGGGTDGSNGLANTGGGGAGGLWSASPGVGGTGVILLSYDTGTFNDMTLISNSTTAEATPTKGDMVCTITNGAGTTTVNTDIKGYVSRDNGANYTQGTLVSQGTTGGHTILTFHDLDISSQPSGTAMRYKITTHNQSASKTTRIQAVSLGWS